MSTKVLYGVHGNAFNGTLDRLKLKVSQKEKQIAARADRIFEFTYDGGDIGRNRPLDALF